MVYEDNGNIYYTHSDDGINWEKETKLNTGSGGNFVYRETPDIQTIFILPLPRIITRNRV